MHYFVLVLEMTSTQNVGGKISWRQGSVSLKHITKISHILTEGF